MGQQQSVRFAGYAALFDRVDRGGDVVKPGAFARTLADSDGRGGSDGRAGGERGGTRIALLYDHDPLKRIGVIERVEEDARGLRVIGRIHGWTPAARSVAKLVEAGALTGLSFGYQVRAMEAGGGGGVANAARTLTDLDLLEISLVPTPMQPHARVHMVG